MFNDCTMFQPKKFLLAYLLFQLGSAHLRLASSQLSPIESAMEAHGVVPDVIDVAPAATITVCKISFFVLK